jgi:hypothetical protein
MAKGVITGHKSEDRQYNDRCIVCPSQIYGLLLPLWSLYCLSSDLWLVITPLVIVLSVLRFISQKSEDRQYNDQRGNNKP